MEMNQYGTNFGVIGQQQQQNLPMGQNQQQQQQETLPKDTFSNDWRNFQLPQLTPPDNSQFLESLQDRFDVALLLQQVRSV